jgi:calcineurin-like phosphoesterase family protein
MIYFTADLHFAHKNVINLCNRTFETVEDMDMALIRNWNGTVRPNDEIYILGDFTMKPAEVAHARLSLLNGRKYFIRGNHDRFLNNYEEYAGDFIWVKDYYMFKYDGRKLVLFHYPIMEWDGFFRGAIHLYGHIHNSKVSAVYVKNIIGPAFNVGVDVNDYKPVSIDKIFIMAKALQKEI